MGFLIGTLAGLTVIILAEIARKSLQKQKVRVTVGKERKEK